MALSVFPISVQCRSSTLKPALRESGLRYTKPGRTASVMSFCCVAFCLFSLALPLISELFHVHRLFGILLSYQRVGLALFENSKFFLLIRKVNSIPESSGNSTRARANYPRCPAARRSPFHVCLLVSSLHRPLSARQVLMSPLHRRRDSRSEGSSASLA